MNYRHSLRGLSLSALTSISILWLTTLPGIAQVPRIVADARPDFQIEYDGSDKPVPKWENGYVLVRDYEPENAPIVSVFGPSGTKVFTRQIVLDGAVQVMLRDIGASPQGVFAVTGAAVDSGGVAINFIAYLDGRGDVKRVVRLQDFVGRRLCFTPDGRLWLAGSAPRQLRTGNPADYNLIRLYDSAGVLHSSCVPRSLFKVDPTPGILFLSASREGVVLLSSATGDLVRVSQTGQVVTSQVRLPADDIITGLAVSDASDVAISTQPSTGLGRARFLLNGNANDWTEVYSGDPNERRSHPMVFGFQNNLLLVGTLRPAPKFSWFHIER